MRLSIILSTFIFLGSSLSWAKNPTMKIVSNYKDASTIRAILDQGERSWILSSAGLQLYQNNRLRQIKTPELGQLYALYLDDDQSLWVGGESGVIRLYIDNKNKIRTERIISNLHVRAIQRYRKTIYLGTWGKGLLYWKNKKLVSARAFRARSLKRITSLIVLKNRLYAGAAGGGIAAFDGKRLRRFRSRGVAERLVWALAKDKNESIWAATSAGLRLLKNNRENRRHPYIRLVKKLGIRDLRSLHFIEDNTLLIGSFSGGAYQLKNKRAQRIAYIDPSTTVYAISNRLWGTDSGLVNQKTQKLINVAQGPISNDISALALSQKGLWVGTFDQGLSFRDAKGVWSHFRMKNGLISNRINHLAVQLKDNKEILWVATPLGVARYADRKWKCFYAGDDLSAGHANAIYISRANKVYVASSKGISIFQPDTERFHRIDRKSKFPLRSATAIIEDQAQQIWIGGIDGIARWDGKNFHRYSRVNGLLPDDWVTAITKDQRGKLWIGTYDSGLAALETRPTPIAKLYRKKDLPCGWVNPQAMAWISDTHLAFGTLDGGLIIQHAKTWSHYGQNDGLPSNDVTAIIKADSPNRYWIATRRGLVLATFKQGEKA